MLATLTQHTNTFDQDTDASHILGRTPEAGKIIQGL